MIRLLDACVINLREQGMKKMFLDAIKGGYEGFQSIGKAHHFPPFIPGAGLLNMSTH